MRARAAPLGASISIVLFAHARLAFKTFTAHAKKRCPTQRNAAATHNTENTAARDPSLNACARRRGPGRRLYCADAGAFDHKGYDDLNPWTEAAFPIELGAFELELLVEPGSEVERVSVETCSSYMALWRRSAAEFVSVSYERGALDGTLLSWQSP